MLKELWLRLSAKFASNDDKVTTNVARGGGGINQMAETTKRKETEIILRNNDFLCLWSE